MSRKLSPEIIEWVRDMGPLHIMVGKLPPGWVDVALTNVSGGHVEARADQRWMDDGRRLINVTLYLTPERSPLALAHDPAQLRLAPGLACQQFNTKGRGQCRNRRAFYRCKMLDGSSATLCNFHAQRAVRDGRALSISRIEER